MKPHIVGYQGHIPLTQTAQCTMGKNFAEASQMGTDGDRWHQQESLRQQHLVSSKHDNKLSSDFAVPGYQGHIPRHRQTLGKSFGLTSQEAINRFQREQETTRVAFKDHYNVLNGALVYDPNPKPKWRSTSVDMGQIYPSETGLIPRYSGYIPGQKFRFGGTSTRLSVNSTNKQNK